MKYTMRLKTKDDKFIIEKIEVNNLAEAMHEARRTADVSGSEYLVDIKDNTTGEVLASFTVGEKYE